MFKGRSGLILALFLILLLVLAVLWLNRSGGLKLPSAQNGQIPIALKSIVPSTWELLKNQPQACNFDKDEDNEWLLLYRYDQMSVLDVYNKDTPIGRSPIGGVVYDAQVNRAPQTLGNVGPYRPALLVPYKLLPDYYTGKGQGYLGESDVKFRRYSTAKADAPNCQADELYFLGYSYEPLPTRLSIFRWRGESTGYAGLHFIGNAHVDAPGTLDPVTTTPINEVTTYNRLDNHRSLLCEVRRFERKGAVEDLNFQEDPGSFTIDFCFGRPQDPVYPEAALIALLRGGNPLAAGSPTDDSFLAKNVELTPELSFLRLAEKRPLVRVLALTNQGTVAPNPAAGGRCPAEMLAIPNPPPPDDQANRWWCAGEEAIVEAEIVVSNQVRLAVARLISIANERVTADVHWRITSLTLQ